MKRVAIVGAVLLAIAAAVIVFEPTGTVLGMARGEKFYRDRPVSWWRKELLDPAPGAQTNAAKALSDGGAAAVPVLVELLGTPDEGRGADVRLMAAQALGHVGPDAGDAVPALRAALTDRSPDVRIAAAEALGKVGPAAAEAVPAMAALLKEEQPARVVRALKALRKLRGSNYQAVPAFVEATRHPDAETRENAAEALGEAGAAAKDAIPVLQGLLDDDNARVREEAAHALKAIRSADKAP
jgi:HEAT repeat protein